MTCAMYLKDTTKLSDQRMSDSTPITFSRVGTVPCGPKHSLMA